MHRQLISAADIKQVLSWRGGTLSQIMKKYRFILISSCTSQKAGLWVPA